MDFCNYRNQPVDKPSCYMYEAMRKDGVETIYERFIAQQPQCGYGANGICCALCSHGPCQITRKADKGVCGANADLIVARNLLLKVAIGTAANVYHARNVARTIEAIGRGKSDYIIKEDGKLRSIAKAVGLDSSGDIKGVALKFGKFFMDQINSNDYEPLKVVEAFALPQRKEIWKKLDIFPGGPNSELLTSLTKSMTNVNSDPVDLLLQGLRLGIVNEYIGLFGATALQEILIGTAKPFLGQANIGIIDSRYVNLLVNGHQPLLAIKVMEAAREKEFADKAKTVGAVGIKFYGSVCEGQSLLNIANEYADVYAGPAGNLIQQELILATGAIDALFFDFNCVLPSLVDVAKHYHTKLISTDKVVRQRETERLEYEPDQAKKIAIKILNEAIEAFTKRKKINIPENPQKAMAGFTTESVSDALGGNLKPLINLIADGTIKGVAALVGCTTVRENQSGFNTQELAKELIKKDILVISAGCASNSLQNAGLLDPSASALSGKNLRNVCETLKTPPCLSYGGCTDIGKIVGTVVALAKELNVDIPQLPIAVSAPEFMEQKAVADAFTAVALGAMIHLAPIPPVLGSKLVTKVLTEDVEGLTGGKVYVELDPVKAAEGIEAHIVKKRKELGLILEKA
jgi:anaerobic carbon-monoxide dehydrogenase catalytic subunit